MTLDEFVRSAKAAWPSWPVSSASASSAAGDAETGFAKFVGAILTGAAGPTEAGKEATLENLRAGDLWLAYHAGLGYPPAVAALEATCFADLDKILRARRADAAESEEVVQRLRHRLLVAGPGEPPRILTYSGRGELRAWVRVAAVRAWLNMKRESPKHEVAQASDALVDEASTDLELELLKGKYRELFRRVFLQAVEALGPSTRLLLKLHYIDRLSMEEVGKILGVHRLTVLRRLERVRQELSESTKERLEVELRLSAPDVESVLRLIQSRLDVSLQQVLHDVKSG